jgi:hypothetical protein
VKGDRKAGTGLLGHFQLSELQDGFLFSAFMVGLLFVRGKRGLNPGIHCSGAEGAVRAINMGFKLVTLSNEVGLMQVYAKMQVNATREKSGGKA